jgi:hypothetical protein
MWVILRVVVHHGHHHRHVRDYILHPGENVMNPIALTVGHTASFTLEFLDANGNPMLTTPTPDAPPVWTDSTPATGTLTSNGLTASELAVAAGSDTVSVALSVAGVAFTATQVLTVSAAPQVLTSVAIETTVA